MYKRALIYFWITFNPTFIFVLNKNIVIFDTQWFSNFFLLKNYLIQIIK